jgi:transcriptional regulator GlxA family with amidase domain
MSAFPSQPKRNVVGRVASNKEKSAAQSVPATSELNFAAAHSTPLQDVRLRKLLRLIEAEPLGTIQDWALEFNLSNSHLQRLFKQATGVGLGHALTEKRLQRAAHLLTNTSMSIKEISYAVGYEHPSSFIRAFERQFEQAPRRFRMRNAA